MTDEKWVSVKGYTGLYSVSDQGRVRNDQRMSILSLAHNHKRRCAVVRLFKEKKRREYSVAKLVWVAFNGPVPSGQIVFMTVPGDRSLANLVLCPRGDMYTKRQPTIRTRVARILREGDNE